MADELKPCPFCGSRAEMDTRQSFRSIFDGKMLEQVCIYCTSCSASVSHYPGDLSFSREDTIDLCVDEWNTRPAAIAAVGQDTQDTEILTVIRDAGDDGIDPQNLIDTLTQRRYQMVDVIETLQRAIERGKISLNGEGMVISLAPDLRSGRSSRASTKAKEKYNESS